MTGCEQSERQLYFVLYQQLSHILSCATLGVIPVLSILSSCWWFTGAGEVQEKTTAGPVWRVWLATGLKAGGPVCGAPHAHWILQDIGQGWLLG